MKDINSETFIEIELFDLLPLGIFKRSKLLLYLITRDHPSLLKQSDTHWQSECQGYSAQGQLQCLSYVNSPSRPHPYFSEKELAHSREE